MGDRRDGRWAVSFAVEICDRFVLQIWRKFFRIEVTDTPGEGTAVCCERSFFRYFFPDRGIFTGQEWMKGKMRE